MRRSVFIILLVIASGMSAGMAQVIPQPVRTEKGRGYFELGEDIRYVLPERLRSYLSESASALKPDLFGTAGKGGHVGEESRSVIFREVPSLVISGSPVILQEAYRLVVTPDSVVAEAPGYPGLFYALQTLFQLADMDRGRIPCVVVEDYPRYLWRGFMLDVSRHFFDADFVKKQIDAMAMLKLNRLHLHLTDAAGWRIEIDRYPLLTSLAAWREGNTWKEWWFGDRKYLPEGTPDAYGGYYTKAQLKDIVRYAALRNVDIVPEIEMPSHSEEVLAAYPELSCTGEAYRHSDFCIGKEETFRFLENVLEEVMEVFPSEYIHVGGDEAGKKAWAECPACIGRMESEGLDGVDELQSYLIRRIGRFLESRGRTLVGWDEILQGGADSSAVVMAWRGVEKGREAVEAGLRTVMTPGAYCYFDTYQDAPELLPEAMGGYLPLAKVYSFDPEETLDGSFILGVQANMWAEYVSSGQHAEMMIYPRLFAVSETGWSRPELKDYADFHSRAVRLCEKMSEAGYNVFDLKNEYGNRPESLRPVRHKASGCKVIYNAPYNTAYAAGGEAALTDGLRGGWTYSDGRWQGFISSRRMDVTVDLGKVRRISSIETDFMQVCGPEVFLPAEVVFSVSDDGRNFTEVHRIEREVVMDDKVTFVTDAWNGNERCRYVRIEARSGKFGGWVFSDEIVIK